MKVLIYINHAKIESERVFNELKACLSSNNIKFTCIDNEDLKNKSKVEGYSVIFSIGGDGTILGLTEFALLNNLPIIGINIGKVGFLTEFEPECISQAVKMLIDGSLKKDARSVLKISYQNKCYFALNDLVVQRLYKDNIAGHVINLSVCLDGENADNITGDGVIVSTPTGSTAYSLAAGGPVLAPGINAFSLTPISAHSLHNRPIIFSADSKCEVKVLSGDAGLFIDGKLVSLISEGASVSVVAYKNKTVFLRKSNSNFYKKLIGKLNRV